jgi:hypothetical protein
MATTILHESAHAAAAFALGVPSTLFNYSANMDFTPAQATSGVPALIRVAGPTWCLLIGAASWFGFPRASIPARLPLLYFAVFGLGTFFGNLMSTPFAGDFSSAASWWEMPATVRYVLGGLGAIGLVALHVWAGRQLVDWAPASAGRVARTLGVVVVPVVVGTAAVILVNQPMTAASVSARVGEALFWIFAAIGALVTPTPRPAADGHGLRWTDTGALLLMILVVRVFVGGIALVP